jgi:hypothetical protein
MKIIKYLVPLIAIVMLSACGHGYEGKYEAQFDDATGLMSALQGPQIFIIGDDYIEMDGQRTSLDDIFVRESDGQRYLVFKDGEEEDAFKIVDENTLVQGNDFLSMTFKRVD